MYIGQELPELTPVEIVGCEVCEAGSPLALDDGWFTGICLHVGYLDYFIKLCNRVGITAYPVCGTVNVKGSVIPHGWVALKIDNSTYYIDPSYVCETGKMDELKLKNEMERTGERVYRLEESLFIKISLK